MMRIIFQNNQSMPYERTYSPEIHNYKYYF